MAKTKMDKLLKGIGSILVIVFCTIFLLPIAACNRANDLHGKISNYTLNLEFDDNTKILSGTQTVDYINALDVTLDEIWFHLYPNAFRLDAKTKPVSSYYKDRAYPNGESEGKIDITKVEVEGKTQEAKINGPDSETLVVKLDDKLYPDDRVKIYLEYQVLLPNCNHRFGYGDNTYNFGNFYPIACKYEDGGFKVDAYGSNGDPFYSDVANYDVNITCDSSFSVATSGSQSVKNVSNQQKLVHASANVVRDFAFVLSKKFEVISGKAGEVQVFYYYYDDENAQAGLKAGIDAINTFSNLFGKYPYPTFSIVKTNFVHGGMEYPNLVYISDAVDSLSEYLNVIIHETAHQWWYGMVGSNACEYAWLDEGLTEYSTLMFYKENPSYNVDVKESLNNSLSSYLLFSEIYVSVYGEFDSSMTRNVNDFKGDMAYVYVTYVKGVLFFDNLNELVGDKKFVKSLKSYFKQNQYLNATPEDMIGAFESTCKRNLQSFFDSWTSGKVVLQNYK